MLDPIATNIISGYANTTNPNWTGVNANGFTISKMIMEQTLIDYVTSTIKTMEHTNSGYPVTTVINDVGQLANSGLSPTINTTYLNTVQTVT